ncbi:hypothetical protein AR540_01110 [Pseudomonas sp. EpS/L25]|nr:hypothetical protein AR540_01110 [Pseudomonas sp. EpS/L25]
MFLELLVELAKLNAVIPAIYVESVARFFECNLCYTIFFWIRNWPVQYKIALIIHEDAYAFIFKIVRGNKFRAFS